MFGWINDTMTVITEFNHDYVSEITYSAFAFTVSLVFGSFISTFMETSRIKYKLGKLTKKHNEIECKRIEAANQRINEQLDDFEEANKKLKSFDDYLINDRLSQIEDLYTNLKNLLLDNMGDNEEMFKIIKESRKNNSDLLDVNNNVLVSHGNVLSKLARNRKDFENGVNGKIDELEHIVLSDRKHLQDMISYIKVQEDRVQELERKILQLVYE